MGRHLVWAVTLAVDVGGNKQMEGKGTAVEALLSLQVVFQLIIVVMRSPVGTHAPVRSGR